jgi:hypothetical protein
VSPDLEAWHAWRQTRPERDDTDVPAFDAYRAGWAAAPRHIRKPWHESAQNVMILLIIAAAVCYVLAGTPH